MTKKYEVIWSNIAENDLKNIVEYIADDSLLDPSLSFRSNVFGKILHSFAARKIPTG